MPGFRIAALVPDRYAVVATTDGAKSERASVSARVNGGDDVELRVVALGRITGRVVSHGMPVPGAKLLATRLSPNARSRTATSQADGTFAIDHVPIGKVVITAPPYRVISPSSVVILSASTPVSILVDVEQTSTIHGRVTRNGAPVVDAVVCCVPQLGGANRVYTDGDGMYEFHGVRAGTHHISAQNETSVQAPAKRS
jgi:Carboxypeptidase regulatory-like domain